MNIRFIVQYDGTRYEGWQRQVRTKETIQGKLEQAIAQVTGETPCWLPVSGRWQDRRRGSFPGADSQCAAEEKRGYTSV